MTHLPAPNLVVRGKGSHVPEPPPINGYLVLSGETTWLFEGPADAIDAAAGALKGLCIPLGPTLLEVGFGNAVGLFEVPGLGKVEVISGKWKRHDFDSMLADIMQVASALPFGAGGTAALPYDRSLAQREEVLYHAFTYLRHILSDRVPPEERLVPAFEQVLRDPHRQFHRRRDRVPTELADCVDLRTLEAVLRYPSELVRASGTPLARVPLAIALRGHIPLTVEQVRVVSTYDTPENRFAKAFLEQAFGVIDRTRERLTDPSSTDDAFAQRLRAECDRMEGALRPVSLNAFWRQIGRQTHMPSQSTVLQHGRGYRDVYRHFVRLRLAARIPLPPQTVRTMLEARDVAELYELWCYFTLVRLLTSLLGVPTYAGRPTASDFEYTVARGLCVRWEDSVAVFYNLHFARTGSVSQRSYSVPLRPDIALEVRNGSNRDLHLLDAKFKLDKIGALLTEPDATEEAEERRGTFKRGDLYKMHTYRDAITRARSVWVLYPGTEARFFPADGNAALLGPPLTFPDQLDGVGALPFVPEGPGAEHATVASLLRHLTHASLVDGSVES